MPDGSIGTVQRAYSLLTIKSVDEEKRIIEGIASTPTTDRMGDIVEPKGANYKLPLPLLWQHNSSQPIGQVLSAKVTADGISIKAQIAKGVLPMIDDAWALIKAGLVRGLSIGFAPIEYNFMKDGGIRFEKWDWYELSAVTIPANAEASIQTIKSLDEQQRAASGHNSAVVRLSPAGVSAPETPKGKTMATHQENLTAFENRRAACVARQDEILATSSAEGRTFEEAEQQEHDALKAEVGKIDKHLPVLRDAAERAKISAKPAEENRNADAPTNKIEPIVLRNNSNIPKGIGMARYVKALAYAKGNHQQALEYSKQWDTSTPEVSMAIKSAIAAGTTTDSAWAGPLVYNQNLASEFVEFLRPQTIIGKMTGFRRVPFNVRFPVQSAGSTVGWTGEGVAKPVSKLQFTSSSLGFAKAAGIVVITQELARYSSPSAEMLVRDDLTAQMVYFLDQQFIDPGVAAVANTNPASITNGAGAIQQSAAAWTSQANVLADIKAFLSLFTAQNIMLDRTAYWVMLPSVGLALSMIVTANGVQAFPNVTIDGGTLFGIPVITSNSVPSSVSAGSIVALVKASEVFLADDGQVAIDVSQEASLQMDTAPTENSGTPTASTVVSMFQTNSLAIRAERVINWARRRSYGVGYIDNTHIA